MMNDIMSDGRTFGDHTGDEVAAMGVALEKLGELQRDRTLLECLDDPTVQKQLKLCIELGCFTLGMFGADAPSTLGRQRGDVGGRA